MVLQVCVCGWVGGWVHACVCACMCVCVCMCMCMCTTYSNFAMCTVNNFYFLQISSALNPFAFHLRGKLMFVALTKLEL